MKINLSESCNKNFITCDANAPLITAIDTYVEKKSKPFILLEDKGQFVGILSPTEMQCMQKYTKHLENLTCYQLIRTYSDIFSLEANEDDVIQQMNENSLDYAIFIDKNKNYLGVVTLGTLLSRKIESNGNLYFEGVSDDELQIYSENRNIINKLRSAEDKYHFSGLKDAIVYYEPIKPISITLPADEIIEQLNNSLLKDCNSAYVNIFGHSKEELINKQYSDRIYRDDTDISNIIRQILINNYRVDNLETHEIDVNGDDKWFLNHVFYEVEDSFIIRWWSRKTDITKQMLLKNELKKNVEIVRESQKLSHTGNWEYNLSNKTLLISDEFKSIFELKTLPPKDPVTTPLTYEFFLKFVDTKDKDMVDKAHKALAEKAIYLSMEYQIITELGNTKQIHEHCKIMYDELGKPQIAIGTIQDMSTMKYLEDISWHTQELFNEMFNNSIDGIFILDVLPNSEYRYVKINPACERGFGLSNSEVASKTISTLFPNETGNEMINSLNRCVRENKSIHIENELTFPAGKKYFSVSLVPMHTQQRIITQVIGVAIDITEKKKVEENLRRLNWALLALNKGNIAISQASSEIDLIDTCCKSITNKNEYFPLCCVFEVNDDPKYPLKIFALSLEGDILKFDHEFQQDKLPGQNTVLKSLFSKTPEIQDITKEIEQFSHSKLKDVGLKSVLALPLKSHHKINFILAVYSKHEDAFKITEIRMFEELGQNIILGIEHQRTQATFENTVLVKDQQSLKLERSLQNTIGALGVMLEARDPFTAGH